ncbi:MAG: nickel-dependent lactate racemase [Candidatus Omnitrophica bacterium]|nr:nickel-dependent lactate racemase [Candidatus Omnitrophota bacterium]
MIKLKYGKSGIELNYPANFVVFEGNDISGIENPEEKIRWSLKNPVGCPPLSKIVRKKRIEKICIVISDHTRAVPNKIILPVIIETLKFAGIPDEKIFILIGNGTHRSTTEEEKIELAGKEIVERFPIYDHCSTDDSMIVRIENTDFYVNKRYLDADLKIVTGMIEPHFFAGFSGGRKGVCPGIAGYQSIKIFHGARFLEHPNTKPGILENNPCHIFATEFARKTGIDFLVNVTINKKGEITGIFSGDFEKAFMKGVEFCKSSTTVFSEKKYKIVITTNGGYPLDRDFYQSVKGMVTALEIVEEGGIIISAAECCDGVGSANFKKLLYGMQKTEDFMKMIMQPGYFHDLQWGVQPLVHVIDRARVFLVSTLSEKDASLCKVIPFKDIDQAIRAALDEYGKETEIAVIPDGPYTIVQLKKENL